MGKYDIRKATGRSQILEQDKLQSVEQTTLAPVPRETEVSSNKSDNSIMTQLEMFDNVVTHNYLSKLSSYPIVPLNNSDKSRMGWYKITRICPFCSSNCFGQTVCNCLSQCFCQSFGDSFTFCLAYTILTFSERCNCIM